MIYVGIAWKCLTHNIEYIASGVANEKQQLVQ